MKDNIEKHLKGGQIRQLQDFIKSKFDCRLLSKKKAAFSFYRRLSGCCKTGIIKISYKMEPVIER